MELGTDVTHVFLTKTLYSTPIGLQYKNLMVIIEGMVVAIKGDWAWVRSEYGTHKFLISTLLINE